MVYYMPTGKKEEKTMLPKRKKETICLLLYCAAAAFFILLFATRSSFLYPCNDWNDANSYFSMGKALFNGRVPYRDIFDQKGMYLYFFYGLAYLVSHTTFAGVFLLELILAVFDLAAIIKILRLYVKKSASLILAPLALAAGFSSQSFYWGGSAEEVCLPFLLWGFYLSLRYFRQDYPDREMGKKTVFVGGLLAGMVANIKFTSLGLFFAWMMCVAFAFLAKRNLKGALGACGIFLTGMALPFVPWAVYFAVNGALYDWYWGYVYINVFAYSNLNSEGPSLSERVYTLSKLLYWVARKNSGYFVFVIPGVLAELLGKGRSLLARFHIFALCFFLFLGIYVGGSELPYYALPLFVFAPLGFAYLGRAAQSLFARWRRKKERSAPFGMKSAKTAGGRLALAGGCAACLLVSAAFVAATSMNTPFLSEKREDIFLYKFREIVRQREDPTLLNIGCLDAGLYTVCDIVPTCRWFQTQTINMDLVYQEQESYVREGRTDFVLARDGYPDVIFEKYELAGEEKWSMGEQEFTYYLFEKKETTGKAGLK